MIRHCIFLGGGGKGREEGENECLIHFYLEPSKGTDPFLYVI